MYMILLDALNGACEAFNSPAVRVLLLKAPLQFQPSKQVIEGDENNTIATATDKNT